MILLAPLAGTVTYSPQPTAVAGQGIILVAGMAPVLLTIKDHGSLARDAWHIVADAASRVAGIIFAELPEGVCESKR